MEDNCSAERILSFLLRFRGADELTSVWNGMEVCSGSEVQCRVETDDRHSLWWMSQLAADDTNELALFGVAEALEYSMQLLHTDSALSSSIAPLMPLGYEQCIHPVGMPFCWAFCIWSEWTKWKKISFANMPLPVLIVEHEMQNWFKWNLRCHGLLDMRDVWPRKWV